MAARAILAAGLACAGVMLGLAALPAAADPVGAHPSVTGDPAVVPPSSRRPPTRLRVYRNAPGPNSVRQCEAHYEQEYRVSGTVIVPRVHCWWEG